MESLPEGMANSGCMNNQCVDSKDDTMQYPLESEKFFRPIQHKVEHVREEPCHVNSDLNSILMTAAR